MEKTIHSIKNTARKKIKEKIIALSASEKQLQSEAICKKLIEESKTFKSDNVLVFMPLSDEIDITPFTEYLLKNNFRTYIPVSFDDSKMFFYELKEFSELEKGKYGILEPQKRMQYTVGTDDTIIVPGVAFDSNCNRLGRGKGYYDIFLSENKLNSIGVSYNEQIIDKIETETHDFKVNKVLTQLFDYKK